MTTPRIAKHIIAANQEWLGRGHMDGSLAIPGCTKPSLDCPPDILEQAPPAPRLNLVTPRADLYPVVPQSLLQAGNHHV